MAFILKYTASVYEAKISRFESLDAQLDSHLDNLEKLRDQVSQFWQGEQTSQYMQAITNAIVKVRKASADIKSLSRVYQEAIDEQNRVGTAVDDVVAGVNAATDKAIDVAKVVVPLVGGGA